MPESLEFEHYEVLRKPDGSLAELGRGAMGVTYRAFDRSLRCDVALKVITASLLENKIAAERFVREARAAAQLRHRNVASVFHLGRAGDSFFYVMEFIEGETVEALVRRRGPLDCRLALDIAQQVASALIAAEKQHLVHRDIKPSNLMVVREDDDEILVKVIDFGLVKSAAMGSSGSGVLTIEGFVGTPYFASPEQLEHQPEDIRSDIYSLGVTLWYMLAGKPTFTGSVASVIAQHLEKPPPFHSLAILPGGVIAVLRGMLEKDRTRRIQTPSLLRADLRACLERLRLPPDLAPLPGTNGNGLQTMTLEGASAPALLPGTGFVLEERYRLIEDLNPDDPGRIFCAEDVVSKGRVSVRLVYGEPAVVAQAEEEVNRVRAVPHPNLVRVHAVYRETGFSCVVCEWLDGFALTDVLEVRQAITLCETLLILEQIVPAFDHVSAAGLRLDLNLQDVLLHFPTGLGNPTEINALMGRPFTEWPAFVVKLNALGRIKALDPGEPGTGRGENMTPPSDKQPSVVSLGILTYAMLGGRPGGFVPLPGLTSAGNEVIRRCLASASHYATAQAFYEALSATDTPARSRAHSPEFSRPPQPTRPLPLRPEAVTATSRAPIAPERARPGSAAEGNPTVKRNVPLILAVVVCTGMLLLLGGAWLWLAGSKPTAKNAVMAPPTLFSGPVATAVSLLPLKAGRPWVNSLEMRFVPLDNIQMAVWPTRVRDFQAFVQATGYDAMGGMSSVIVRDGFRLATMGWKNPGFVQTADHPVVGVSWEDANQFCAWLTQKERQAGLLGAADRYRLPTDREWSAAVGLANEPGAVPEDRDGKVKGLYPWGRTFPPPPGAGNYAGAESSAGAPESWTVISGYRDPFPRTAPVSALTPNPRGLCSVGGNVWEWCLDRFNAVLPWRTLRGASWATSRAEEMLSSSRRGYNPYFRSDDVGFRCVIAADGGQP
ncbi:MAG: SUMF1/EgtB/PvdO family nonheme iron enzyme [Verrucomicrobia bacterium]|nr:SUMF1/EgtB/PvdO family nonheme iron enzyme [Verrucomicrobiota bacterium]